MNALNYAINQYIIIKSFKVWFRHSEGLPRQRRFLWRILQTVGSQRRPVWSVWGCLGRASQAPRGTQQVGVKLHTHIMKPRYATGTIVREYTAGQAIDVTVELTANHRGDFTFKLCPAPSSEQDPGQECFDLNTLTTSRCS